MTSTFFNPCFVQTKKPSSGGWTIVTNWKMPPQMAAMGYPVVPWWHEANELFVLSSVEVARDPGTPDLGPLYHLSVSKGGQKRCTSADAVWVLAQFDLLDALEDNHVPGGFVRNFWRPVADHLSGYECPCVDTEPAIVEDKGDFVWRGVTN